jgi:hypothetical protein
MNVLGIGLSTLIVLILLGAWWRYNRCLGLLGSALAGAAIISGIVDSLWAWGTNDPWFSVLVPLLVPLAVLFLLRWAGALTSRRWVVFGIIGMFLIRLVVLAPTHVRWSGRLSGSVREWLIMAGLDPSTLPTRQVIIPPYLHEIEMPCGLQDFQVRSSEINSSHPGFTLRIEECGFLPQAFSSRGAGALEISSSLAFALEVRFAPQTEDGGFLESWSVVVPPESSIEVPDFRVPVGGAVLIYAPLQVELGIVFASDPRVPGEFQVSRDPLLLRRQSFDAP